MNELHVSHSPLRELHLFAGAGGGILGGILLGHTCVCAVEIEPYCRRVLLQRQRDGVLPPFPIWDDIRTFDGTPWRGRVDVVCGGFPCQDISLAGKGAGIEAERSGLWSEMFRVISEVRPSYVFVENSTALTFRGAPRVTADLASLGYVGRNGCLGGFSTGLCINGERMWIVATAPDLLNLERLPVAPSQPHPAASSKRQFDRAMGTAIRDEDHAAYYRDPDAVARGMDRFKAIGNGQIPIVAATAWRVLAP